MIHCLESHSSIIFQNRFWVRTLYPTYIYIPKRIPNTGSLYIYNKFKRFQIYFLKNQTFYQATKIKNIQMH